MSVASVAVAVDGNPHIVLDEEYRIVEVGSAAQAHFGALLGQKIDECFPGSRPLFLPYYEEARRTKRVVEFAQFYDGYIMRLRATPEGSRLVVSWEVLGMLDVLTLDGLRMSLQAALQALAGSEEALRRESVRSSLQVVGGSG
jgi:hypothetical protein